MNKKTYEIDGLKLRAELKRVFPNDNEAEIARMIGFEASYFHNVVSRNKIGKVAVLWLEGHGIPLESYLPTKEEPEEEEIAEVVGEDISEILNGIEAIYGKIEDVNVKLENLANIRFGANGQDSAISMTKEELQNVIYRAVYSAVLHAWETPE